MARLAVVEEMAAAGSHQESCQGVQAPSSVALQPVLSPELLATQCMISHFLSLVKGLDVKHLARLLQCGKGLPGVYL